MRRILFAMIALAAAAAAAADGEPERLTMVGKADEAIARGEWAQAEELLLGAMRSEPGNPTNVLLLSNLGIVRYNMGLDSLALATLDDARRMAPASVTVLGNRARVLTGMGRLDEAVADYEEMARLDSTIVAPRFYHGIIMLSRGELERARADFEAVAALEPESFEANLGMASLMDALGRWTEAVPYYNKVIKLDAQPEYYGARALCFLQAGMLSEASDDIASGLALDPADGELYLYRAILNKMRYRPGDADADGRRAVELGVPAARVRALLGGR